jgi:hypothetical protein
LSEADLRSMSCLVSCRKCDISPRQKSFSRLYLSWKNSINETTKMTILLGSFAYLAIAIYGGAQFMRRQTSISVREVATLAAYAVLTSFLFIYVILPRYLSPLRSIPQARMNWRFRLYQWIYTEPTPVQLARWAESSPSHGLIRYYGIGGSERLLPLHPEAIKETLVTKAYDVFERPRKNRIRFGTLFGYGLLSAEGEAHKVCEHRTDRSPSHKLIFRNYRMQRGSCCRRFRPEIFEHSIQSSGANRVN